LVLHERVCVKWAKNTETWILNGSAGEKTLSRLGLVRALPDLLVHEFIDWVLFGKVYRKVHRKMDEPFKYLGRSHRVLFHDYASAYFIAKKFYPDDPNAVLAAYYHIYYDELCSENPEYKKTLEIHEILTRKDRKKRRKRAVKEEYPLLEPLFSDLKKMAEIKRLLRIFYSLS
jgi:hypothetical protein